MRIFDFDEIGGSPHATELVPSSVQSEETLESWLHANPGLLLDEPLLIFGRQSRLSTGIPDLLALDQWGNVVIFELKKGTTGRGSASEQTILSQPQNYAQALSDFDYDALDEIYQAYRTALNNQEWAVDDSFNEEPTLIDAFSSAFGPTPEPQTFNTHQRMVIVAEEITDRTVANTEYLHDQGLHMQCVEVQRFDTPEEPTDAKPAQYSVIGTTIVVDYPISLIKPADQDVDYEALTRAVRDQVLRRVPEATAINDTDVLDVAATPKELQVESCHPEHPSTVRYIVQPRIQTEASVNIKMNIWGADDDVAEGIYSVLAEAADELDSYEFQDKRIGTIRKEYPVEGYDYNEGVIDTVVDDLAGEFLDLLDDIHPQLVASSNPDHKE